MMLFISWFFGAAHARGCEPTLWETTPAPHDHDVPVDAALLLLVGGCDPGDQGRYTVRVAQAKTDTVLFEDTVQLIEGPNRVTLPPLEPHTTYQVSTEDPYGTEDRFRFTTGEALAPTVSSPPGFQFSEAAWHKYGSSYEMDAVIVIRVPDELQGLSYYQVAADGELRAPVGGRLTWWDWEGPLEDRFFYGIDQPQDRLCLQARLVGMSSASDWTAPTCQAIERIHPLASFGCHTAPAGPGPLWLLLLPLIARRRP